MLPAFCRVAATLTPSSDSDIKIEVWLPDSTTWNGKFQAVGNGGWAGTIGYPAMATALAAGYATTSTDTGHVGNTAAFALGHPEKVIDIGYRAIHEMTVQAKAIVNGYYSSAPKYSYFNGCSLGGRQGITEAQRYPADFDGIVAGAVAWGGMDRYVGVVMIEAAIMKASGAYIPPEKYPALHDAVLEACDGVDGVKDGILENPLTKKKTIHPGNARMLVEDLRMLREKTDGNLDGDEKAHLDKVIGDLVGVMDRMEERASVDPP